MIKKLRFAGVKGQKMTKNTFWAVLSKKSMMGFLPLLIFPLKDSVPSDIIFSSKFEVNFKIVQLFRIL